MRNAEQWPNKAAIREKDYGIWQTYSWADYLNQVHEFALGLRSLGFQRKDRLGIIGDNRPQLYWDMAAAQCIGGMPVPLYQDSIAQEVESVLNHAEIQIIVAEDQEQVDKILELKEDLPLVREIISEKFCAHTFSLETLVGLTTTFRIGSNPRCICLFLDRKQFY